MRSIKISPRCRQLAGTVAWMVALVLLSPAQALVERLFTPLVGATEAEAWTKDAKTELQEWLQARRQPLPGYRIESTHGRHHEQQFVVVCSVPAFALEVRGAGRSRRAAEQEAARAALATLKSSEPPRA